MGSTSKDFSCPRHSGIRSAKGILVRFGETQSDVFHVTYGETARTAVRGFNAAVFIKYSEKS